MTHDRAWRCNLCGWLSPMTAKVCVSCEKKKPRAKTKKPDPVFRPWQCVVLAIDSGEKSGWSIHVLGKLREHGEFNILTNAGVAECSRICDAARTYALNLGVPWVAFIESSWGGRMEFGRPKTGWYWTFAMRNAQLPRARIGDVMPGTWRARVLPRGSVGKVRDEIRAIELAAARRLVNGADVGPDEAPAILIGKWATQAGETGELLPKNKRVTI